MIYANFYTSLTKCHIYYVSNGRNSHLTVRSITSSRWNSHCSRFLQSQNDLSELSLVVSYVQKYGCIICKKSICRSNGCFYNN